MSDEHNSGDVNYYRGLLGIGLSTLLMTVFWAISPYEEKLFADAFSLNPSQLAVENYDKFWLPCVTLTLVWGSILFKAMDTPVLEAKLVASLILGLMLGYWTVIQINGRLDKTEPEVFKAVVTAKRAEENSYRLSVEPWGRRNVDEEIYVNGKTFQSAELGEEVTIYLKPGFIGIPWYYTEPKPEPEVDNRWQ